MRSAVALFALLSVVALATALADPAPAKATPAADKPAADPDVAHFLAEGYKPETRGGRQVYCKKQGDIGSRITAKTICATIEELRVREQNMQKDVQQSH